MMEGERRMLRYCFVILFADIFWWYCMRVNDLTSSMKKGGT
jgi:hypothetical protein